MGAYEVAKSVYVDAPPAQVRAHLVDFRQWRDWSPWEDLDPDLKRDYSGPTSGVGASYAWSGNKKAGVGSMEITHAEDQRVDLMLHFEKPFPAENEVSFELLPVDGGTQVTWSMRGVTKGLFAVITKVVPMDKFVGKDFEKGLASLKSVAEAG
ncbi:SRPBCC family protein [Nocardioides humilatus]|uniref:SRPBCC family protein n=1 Tax=Nocardioides humilatus TaxID=2607660 RepID=A0A5B1LG33_9ACTN|nr:SRPBCC family protein [Nocardioides humilatus]KAA1418639.1 SRPBCC family protein [Nocardioides humilatus]